MANESHLPVWRLLETDQKPIELEVTSNTGNTEALECADGKVLYVKPGKPKLVMFDFRDAQYHIKDCGCKLCLT